MTQKLDRQQTARFRVNAADGTSYTVDEFTTTARILLLSGSWSPPQTTRVEYLSAGRPVNLNDDGSFDVFTGSLSPVRCRRA